MSLLTVFSAPKPFTDPRVALIQSNAIASWARLKDVEVLLLGNEHGLADAARKHHVRRLPDIGRNASGTPTISSMVRTARDHSDSGLLCIINADMIVMADLVDSARRVAALEDHFLLLGRRWDLAVEEPIEFVQGWEDQLRERAREQGNLHRPAGSDFFIFPRAMYTEIPDFAVGRAGWDNWMIFDSRRAGVPVIDGTPSITAIHQNHDYGHLPGGEPHYGMPESRENIRLAGGEGPIRYTVLDATHVLKDGRLSRPAPSLSRTTRRIEVLLRRVFFFLPANTLEDVARPKRWKKKFLRLLGRS